MIKLAVLQDFKCPCCDGAIEFDSSLQKMKCPYCSSEFEIADLQQMTDPMTFIEKTFNQYVGLDFDEVRQAFEEVKIEVLREKEEKGAKVKAKKQP